MMKNLPLMDTRMNEQTTIVKDDRRTPIKKDVIEWRRINVMTWELDGT